MPREKVCKICRRFVEGDICPADKSTDLTRSWRGMVFVFDPASEIAKAMGIIAPGKYAIEVK